MSLKDKLLAKKQKKSTSIEAVVPEEKTSVAASVEALPEIKAQPVAEAAPALPAEPVAAATTSSSRQDEAQAQAQAEAEAKKLYEQAVAAGVNPAEMTGE